MAKASAGMLESEHELVCIEAVAAPIHRRYYSYYILDKLAAFSVIADPMKPYL
jgi:hypothetical protein